VRGASLPAISLRQELERKYSPTDGLPEQKQMELRANRSEQNANLRAMVEYKEKSRLLNSAQEFSQTFPPEFQGNQMRRVCRH
jgi:hypothetical protein